MLAYIPRALIVASGWSSFEQRNGNVFQLHCVVDNTRSWMPYPLARRKKWEALTYDGHLQGWFPIIKMMSQHYQGLIKNTHTCWYNMRWTWSTVIRCSLYMVMTMAFQIWETSTFGLYLIWMSDVANSLTKIRLGNWEKMFRHGDQMEMPR